MKKESLLDQWKKKKEKEHFRPKITKAPENLKSPLSKGQERLWFLQQLYPNNPFYNYAGYVTFKGSLNFDYLEKSLSLVFDEHNIFKTSFDYSDGKTTQSNSQNLVIPLYNFDLSSLKESDKQQQKHEILKKESEIHFDLAKPPLIKLTLIKEDNTHCSLLIIMHHIIVDKWSLDIFMESLSYHYRNFLESGNSEAQLHDIQYTDYAYWEQKNTAPKEQIEYWKSQLSGKIPTLDLPTDYSKPLQTSFRGALLSRKFSKELSNNILKIAKEMEVTPYVLLLSAYYVLLYKYSGQEDILVGTPISNRDQKILEGVIGFFNDTVVLRASLNKELMFQEFLKQTKKMTMDAFQNKNVPFDVLVKTLNPERTLSDNPFFKTMFLYNNKETLPSFGPDLKMEQSLFDLGISKFDLTLYIAESEEGLSATFEYSTDLFVEATINRMHKHLYMVLNAVATNPRINISKIPILTDEEQGIIFRDSSPQNHIWQKFSGIHEIIIDAAKQNIDKVAVLADGISMSYAQLLEESDSLAQCILDHTQGRKQIIALALNRTTNLLVGMLGILKSGCAYLPIDPEYPTERSAFVINDAKVNLIVTQTSLKSKFKAFNTELVFVNCLEKPKEQKVYSPPQMDLKDMAYIIYTSGSTGQPKGVPISHGNIINSTRGRLDFYKKNPESFLVMSSISFDSSKAGIFWTLCTGGTLVLSPKHLEQDLEKMTDIITKHNVSHTLMLPSLYNLLLENETKEKLTSLKTVIVAGEACTPQMVETHFEQLPSTALYNEYGPTEATVWCLAHKIEVKDIRYKIPIGKSVAGAKVFLLDEDLNLVPFGATGTIYVAGDGLSDGYWQRPDLTSKAFVPNPFSENLDGKMYNTGDLGKYQSDGSILFVGRMDQQIKIRGHRIELLEIENLLLKYPKIKDAVVLIESGLKEKIKTPSINYDVEGIVEFINKKLNKDEVEEVLSTIENLNEFQKNHLLEQFEH